MAHIPDQPVFGGVEQIMQRDRQLNYAQASAEMAAGLPHGIQQIGAQLIHYLCQLLAGQGAQLLRPIDAVQKGSGWPAQRYFVKRLRHAALDGFMSGRHYTARYRSGQYMRATM